MTADLSLFKDLDKSYLSRVRIGNGDYVKVEGKWAIEVKTLSDTKTLKNVLYVPKINKNLITQYYLMMEYVILKTKIECYCFLQKWWTEVLIWLERSMFEC